MNKLIYSSDSEEDMEPRGPAVRNITIDEYESELEVKQLYRRLLVESLRSAGENNKTKSNYYNESVKKVSTRAVQTDPEMASIQPSWLVSVQMLVDQLHAEIGNLINSAYHQSNTWRYLRLENGCWQSTLLPNVRIPVPRDFKGVKPFTVEEMRQSLSSLHELTRKLQILIPEPMDDAYRTEMYAYMEKRGTECASEDRASDLKQVKEHIYGAVASSGSASRGKVLEVNNYLADFNATGCHRNPHLASLKSCSLFSQKTEANGVKAAYHKASDIWKERASSSKDGKTVKFQERDILVDGAASKSGLSNCREWIRLSSQDIASNTRQNEVQKRQNFRSKSDLSNYGSVARGTQSAIAESSAAGNKTKIPGDVLADYSNIPLKRENYVGNGASVRDIKNKLSVIKENKDENRAPNFIKRNILAVKNPVIQSGASRSFVKRVVPKLSKPVKMN